MHLHVVTVLKSWEPQTPGNLRVVHVDAMQRSGRPTSDFLGLHPEDEGTTVHRSIGNDLRRRQGVTSQKTHVMKMLEI